VEANASLGFKPDLRDYGIGAQILLDLGLTSIRLLTNNPRKIVGLEGYGLKVTGREPIQVQHTQHNLGYLTTKRSKLGHLLDGLEDDLPLDPAAGDDPARALELHGAHGDNGDHGAAAEHVAEGADAPAADVPAAVEAPTPVADAAAPAPAEPAERVQA